jgi:hypothetical protein
MGFLERLGLVRKSTIKREVPSFSQADARQAFLTRAGNRFFNDLDHPTQQRVSEVFAGQDEEGLKQLVEKYDAPTVEAMSLALDDAVKSVIGDENSYHSWATGVLQNRGEQSSKGQ